MDNLKVEILKEAPKDIELNFKVIVIGDVSVGKTCLTNMAINNKFIVTSPNINIESFDFIIKLDEKIIKLQIFDTAGQEAYRSLITQYYKKSALVMIVYSIDSKNTFNNIPSWIRNVRDHCNPDVKLFLIGNKADLEEEREIEFNDAKNFAKENGFDYVKETSAKNGLNAKEVFIEAAKILYMEYNKYKNIEGNDNKKEIPKKIEINKQPKRNNGGCC